MTKKSPTLDSYFFLQLALGLFFLMLGIMGLSEHNSKLSAVARFLGRNDTLRVIMSVVEIVMGVALAAKLFVAFPDDVARTVSIALFALWALYMLVNLVLNNNFMEPTAVAWLYNLAWHSVILASLWIVGIK
jgi:hypothetical protein